MDKQETFDTVVAHARKQGRQALDCAGDCQYRTEGGLKCFVGALIPDSKYSDKLESMRIRGLRASYVPYNAIETLVDELGHNLALCSTLQSVHDNHPNNEWEWRLESVAVRYGLKYTKEVDNG